MMRIRSRLRQLSEDIGGCFTVAVGLGALLVLFLIRHSPVFVSSQLSPTVRLESIRANTVSGADLQKRLDDIAAKKRAIEAARLAAIRAEQQAKRKAEEEKRLAAEKAAKQKAAKEKAAKEKAAKEKAAKEKAAKEKAAKEKAAKEKAKLAAIDAVPTLSGLSSYDAQAALAAKNAAIEAFRNSIKNKIRRSWSLPDISGDRPVQLSIRLDPQGRVIAVNVTQPSGCPLCDAQAIRAVQEASPFSPPNNRDARRKFLEEGLVIKFNPPP